MPTTYAHYRFGKEVTEALPRGLQNTIEYHRDLYDIGLHGPDIREFDSWILEKYLAGLIKPAFFMSNFPFLYVLVCNSVL